MADHQKEEVRSELHTLLQNKQISKEAFDHAESALSQEWGPHKGLFLFKGSQWMSTVRRAVSSCERLSGCRKRGACERFCR